MESSLVFLAFLILSFLHFVSAENPNPSFPKEALPTTSGYLPINPNSTSAIFYTFYEAQKPITPPPQTPLLIWLQGGPGCSSMLGNLFELGPWRVNSDLVLEPNPGAWNNLFGLIFIDNPIGTGFSIASTPQEIPTDQETVAKHLFVAIRSFILLYPSFRSRPIYITGESYAGKYVPAIGSYILKQNSRLHVSRRVNLAGVAIGNGLTHPVTQVAAHAATAYYSGLINEKQRNQIEELQSVAVSLTRQEKWTEAADARNKVLNTLQNMTGLATLYDFRRGTPYDTDLVGEFLSKKEVKKAFGVAESMEWEECSDAVGLALHQDVMKSVKFMVDELVKKSKVLLYQGQFDLRDGVVSTEVWVKELEWEGLDQFLMADRLVWNMDGECVGYVQRWGRLSQVVVSGAGHLVPADQALSSQAMIQDWVLGRGLFSDDKVIRELCGHFRLKSGKNGIFVNNCRKASRHEYFGQLQLSGIKVQLLGHPQASRASCTVLGLLHAYRGHHGQSWAWAKAKSPSPVTSHK